MAWPGVVEHWGDAVEPETVESVDVCPQPEVGEEVSHHLPLVVVEQPRVPQIVVASSAGMEVAGIWKHTHRLRNSRLSLRLRWRVAQRRNNYDFGENEIFTLNWPGNKGASFGTIKFSKNLLINYLISIFNLNAFMKELGKNICSFERPIFFFSKQKLVRLLKEALNVRREAVLM